MALPKSDLRYVTTDLRPDIKHDNGLIRYLPPAMVQPRRT